MATKQINFSASPTDTLEALRVAFLDYWESLDYGERKGLYGKLKISPSTITDLSRGKLPVVTSGMADRLWSHLKKQ